MHGVERESLLATCFIKDSLKLGTACLLFRVLVLNSVRPPVT